MLTRRAKAENCVSASCGFGVEGTTTEVEGCDKLYVHLEVEELVGDGKVKGILLLDCIGEFTCNAKIDCIDRGEFGGVVSGTVTNSCLVFKKGDVVYAAVDEVIESGGNEVLKFGYGEIPDGDNDSCKQVDGNIIDSARRDRITDVQATP